MSDNSEIVWAAMNGENETIKSYLEKGADVNAKVKSGRTLLHLAADFGHLELLKLLINMGADVNITDDYGVTALLSAIYEKHLDCVKFLLENGADKSIKTPDGKSYCEVCEDEEIECLLK